MDGSKIKPGNVIRLKVPKEIRIPKEIDSKKWFFFESKFESISLLYIANTNNNKIVSVEFENE